MGRRRFVLAGAVVAVAASLAAPAGVVALGPLPPIGGLPPSMALSFSGATVPLNTTPEGAGGVTLTVTISNPDQVHALTGVSGFVEWTYNKLQGVTATSSLCGTISVGAASVSFNSLGIGPNRSCTFTATLLGIAPGLANADGRATSADTGDGGPAYGSITVVAPPVTSMSFSPSSVALNGTSTLKVSITNPATNTVHLTGVSFAGTLPAGLNVASTGGDSICNGSETLTAPAGYSVTGGDLAPGEQCVVNIPVKAVAAGTITITKGAGSSNGGTGTNASASLSVTAPPTPTPTATATPTPTPTHQNGATSTPKTSSGPNATGSSGPHSTPTQTQPGSSADASGGAAAQATDPTGSSAPIASIPPAQGSGDSGLPLLPIAGGGAFLLILVGGLAGFLIWRSRTAG